MGGSAVISADCLGLRQRLYGGPIVAGAGGSGRKYITIPMCAEAYGTQAADWGDNLVFVITSNGNHFLALWLGTAERRSAYRDHLGKLDDAFNPNLSEKQRKAAQKGLWHYSENTTKRVGMLRAAMPRDT